MPISASAISTVPHGLFDLGTVVNTHVAQGPVIEAFQGIDSPLDLAFATPIRPEACNQIPRPSRTPPNDAKLGCVYRKPYLS
jgi:hypothetical protein